MPACRARTTVSPERMPAAQMHQKHTQETLRRLVLAQPLQGTRLGGQNPPVVREECRQQFPVLFHSARLRINLGEP